MWGNWPFSQTPTPGPAPAANPILNPLVHEETVGPVESPSHQVQRPVPDAGPSTSKAYQQLASKSSEDLRMLIQDAVAWRKFVLASDQLKEQDRIIGDLQKSNLEYARKNLAYESEISELKTQCRIIRTSELAPAQERLNELIKEEKKIRSICSPSAIIEKLKRAVEDVEERSDALHRRFLAGEIELAEFLKTYQELRLDYHKRNLLRQSAEIWYGGT